MLFYLVVAQTATGAHVSEFYNIVFMFTLKKYFILNVLETHFDCFNSQVNNLDAMEREQQPKFKSWLLAGEEIYEPKFVSSKYLKNIL